MILKCIPLAYRNFYLLSPAMLAMLGLPVGGGNFAF